MIADTTGKYNKQGGSVLAEFNNDSQNEFRPVDVSVPRETLKEADILREQAALRRYEWIRSHTTLIFAVISIILVAAIVFGILMYSQRANPISRMTMAAAKDFGTSFDFDVTFTAKGTPSMHYTGSIDSDRGAHQLSAFYNADYGTYTYSGAVSSVQNKAYKGAFYQEKWTIEDCSAQMQNFFDFEVDFSRGEFDGGALLRFLGLTSDFSAKELNRFESWLRQRMSTNSTIATVTSSGVEGGTQTTFDIRLEELFSEIAENGAPMFYHSSDYDTFKKRYEANKPALEQSRCIMSCVVDKSGYLSRFTLTVAPGVGDESYEVDCKMSNFGKAEVEVPEAFIQAISAQKDK